MPSIVHTIISRSRTEREKRIEDTEGLDKQAKVVLAVLADTADALDRLAERAKDSGEITAPLVKFAAQQTRECFERAFEELEGWGLL